MIAIRTIILFVCLISLTSVKPSQGNDMVEYTDWIKSNEGCYGCSSFYFKIYRSQYSYEGHYYYYVYFYSNSFYRNGVWANTFLDGINIHVDKVQGYGQWSRHLLFKDNTYGGYAISTNPKAYINIYYDSKSIY